MFILYIYVSTHSDTSDKDGDVTYDEAALEKWTSSCALLLHILDTVFQPCFSFVSINLIYSKNGN